MNYLDVSMHYEGQYGLVTSRIVALQFERNKDREIARLTGREPNPAYTEEIERLKVRKAELRKKSDDAFLRHRAKAELDYDGIINLAVAVGEQMAMDYEDALSKGKQAVIDEVEAYAGKDGNLYNALTRIRAAHKRFVEMAHKNIFGIVAQTEAIEKIHDKSGFKSQRNPYRCPLCNGGVYAKSKTKSDIYVVGCTGCFLTEVVTVNS